MPYTNPEISDTDKLYAAFQDILASFGSVDAILEAFGLANMPLAHRYGMLFGFLVFSGTVTSVLVLLIFGGSFKRIQEQAVTGESTILTAGQARRQRALLYEELLEARQRMVNDYETSAQSPLLHLLLNQAPSENPPPHLITDENKLPKKKNSSKKEQFVPHLYKENYVKAYRRCQDRPGGSVISGRPEARYEAYARAYAGCGPYTTHAYKCSYARLCEALACGSHESNDVHNTLFTERPYDLLGKYVRLEALDAKHHASDLFQVTAGSAMSGNKSFDPQDVWAFLPAGPFSKTAELEHSFVFQSDHSAGFAVVDMVTDALVGCVRLTHDDPRNLTVQLEPPIMPPQYQGSQKQLEACFLLMDRLFALGYRRIQLSIDSQDVENQKLAKRLYAILEGILRKHGIVKDANRDSKIYSIVNSDFRAARSLLFGKLYGATMLKYDQANEKFETEQEEQEEFKDQEMKKKL